MRVIFAWEYLPNLLGKQISFSIFIKGSLAEKLPMKVLEERYLVLAEAATCSHLQPLEQPQVAAFAKIRC